MRCRRVECCALALAFTVATAMVAVRWTWFTHPDVFLAHQALKDLTSRHPFRLYVDNPLAQMGPLAIVLMAVPRAMYVLVVSALGGLCAYWLLAAATVRVVGVRVRLTACVCLALLVVPWSQLAWKGHADDALVLTGAALMIFSAGSRRTFGSMLGFGIAMAGKPTAILLFPLLWSTPFTAVVGALVGLVVYGGFLLADSAAFLTAGKGVMAASRGSLPAMLAGHAGGPPPGWVRPVELVLGMAAVRWGTVRQDAPVGLLLAFSLRAALEPNPAPAYSIPMIALALLPDLRRGWPVLTALSALSFWLSQQVLNGGSGWPRLLSLALVILLAARELVHGGQAQPPAPVTLGKRRTTRTYAPRL